MTKPVTRKMAVQATLYRFQTCGNLGPEGAFITCPECDGTISPDHEIDFDHAHADVHGGPHEYQNLVPMHRRCHQTRKTPRDIKANCKVKRIRGDNKPKMKRAWPSQKMQGKP